MIKKYIYHYSTQRYTSSKMEHIDGILTLSYKIESMEDYRHIKKMIDPKNYKDLVIVSLSFLKVKRTCFFIELFKKSK